MAAIILFYCTKESFLLSFYSLGRLVLFKVLTNDSLNLSLDSLELSDFGIFRIFTTN